MNKLSENAINVLSSVRVVDIQRKTALSRETIRKALDGGGIAASTIKLLDLIAAECAANPPVVSEPKPKERALARLAMSLVPGDSAKITTFTLYGSDEEKIFQDALHLQKLGFAANRSSVVRAAIRAFDPSKVKP